MNRHEPITQGYSLAGLAMRETERDWKALCRHIRMCVRKHERERENEREEGESTDTPLRDREHLLRAEETALTW